MVGTAWRISNLAWCLVACCGLGVQSVFAANDAPRITFDALLSRKVVTASNLQWYNSERLLGQFGGSGDSTSSMRTISVQGKQLELPRYGDYPSISPDGQQVLAFADDRWVMRDVLGTLVADVEPPVDQRESCKPRSSPVWSKDGRFAAFVECYGRRIFHEPAESTTGVPVLDMADHHASLRPGSQIAIMDRTRPSDTRRIAIDEFALEMAWGPNGLLYVSSSELITGDASTRLLRIDPETSAVTEIYETPGRFQDMLPAVHPDGGMIALVLDADRRIWEDFQSLILIDAETGNELRRLTKSLPLVGSDYCWSRTGDELYVRVRQGGLDQIYAVPLAGEPRPLTNGKRRHYSMTLSPNGRRLAYRTEDGYGRRDIRTLNLETAEERVLIVLDEPANEFGLGSWQHIRWHSTDGVRPYGYLILPPAFDPAQRYPMLVYVHGGGQGSRLYLNGLFSISVAPGPLEWHVWAARGFIVFVPDYRSTGDYGPDPIGSIQRSGVLAATKDIEDIVSGTKHIIQQGYVDPAKLAILGHSAGGQRAFLLLTRYSLFSAAVINEAIPPDPVSIVIGRLSGDNVGQYPDGVFRHLFGGRLDEYPVRYKVNYMLDSHRISTPTLLMVGNQELGGVNHMPIEVIYSILRQYSTPTRMLKFPEEGHTYSRPASATYAFDQATHWIDTHLSIQQTVGPSSRLDDRHPRGQ